MEKTKGLPRSASNAVVVTLGFLTLIGCFFAVRNFKIYGDDIVSAALFCIFITGTVVFSLDTFWQKVYLRPSTGLDFSKSQPSFSRTLLKLVGLLGSVGFIAFLYWLFSEYHGTFYNNYWLMLEKIWLPWAILAIVYFYFVDERMKDPRDGYWHMGQVVLLRWKEVDLKILGNHLRGWLIKGFFLPLMFVYFCRDLHNFCEVDFSNLDSFKPYFDFFYDSIFLVDVGIVSIGYLLSLKFFDTHIRSAEPTIFGWVVALFCYEPFWASVERNYMNYSTDYGWGAWLGNSPTAYAFWGTCILVLFSIYLWASTMFGCRFSNLTHRGILTNGPYRFTKHPAYISKNIAWWMISIPFLAQDGWSTALQKSILLLGVNAIYFLRAKTEERNLSQDPVYREYAQWIEQNGLFRRFKTPVKLHSLKGVL